MTNLKLIFKLLFLQLFWFVAVGLPHEYQNYIFAGSGFIAVLNYFIFRPSVSFLYYGIFLFLLTTFGFLHDFIFKELGWVNYQQDDFPLWLTSLYMVFICYYGGPFNTIARYRIGLQSLLGGLGGVMAYYGGASWSGIAVQSNLYYFGIFLAWSLFFPTSLYWFYKKR
jgi:hypothetical protein